jgi:hypothetical protein
VKEGTEKLAIDIPASIKAKLKDLAHQERSSMTQVVIDLINQAAIKNK